MLSLWAMFLVIQMKRVTLLHTIIQINIQSNLPQATNKPNGLPESLSMVVSET